MDFQSAASQFNQFKNSNAPTTDGVQLKSRGKYFLLDFDLQLIDGKIAIVAKPIIGVQAPTPTPTTNKRK